MHSLAHWIAVCALCVGLAPSLVACASPPDAATPTSAISNADLDHEIGALRDEIARDRDQIAARLTEGDASADAPLSEEPEFRALAGRLVALQTRLDELESEKAQRAAAPATGGTP